MKIIAERSAANHFVLPRKIEEKKGKISKIIFLKFYLLFKDRTTFKLPYPTACLLLLKLNNKLF